MQFRNKGFIFIGLFTAVTALGVGVKFGLFPSSPRGDQGQGEGKLSAKGDKTDAKGSTKVDDPAGLPEPESLDPQRLKKLDALAVEALALEHLHKLNPTQRMIWLSKVLSKDRDFKPVSRGSVSLRVEAPGTIVSGSMSDVDVLIAGTIRDIVPNGAMVKKGDKLLEIDDKARKELLQKKNDQIVRCSDEHRQAMAALGKLRQQVQSVVAEAELEWKLADLALKRFKGDDAAAKKKLELQVQQTQQNLERARAQATSLQEGKAIADVQAKKANLEQVLVEHLTLEGEIGRCVLTAPRQGMVIYHLAPIVKDGETTFPSWRPGDSVSQGQVVMRICDDLDHLFLTANIDAARAAQLRPGQKAFLQGVASLPNRAFPAKVKSVGDPGKGPTAPARIELLGNVSDLRPLMTGSVLIVIDDRANCLRLPLVSAMSGAMGKEKHCFVLSGNELQERQLTTGLANNEYAEILTGLEEGDRVLDLQSVIRRQAEYLKYR